MVSMETSGKSFTELFVVEAVAAGASFCSFADDEDTLVKLCREKQRKSSGKKSLIFRVY
jgi:hypothetical protein